MTTTSGRLRIAHLTEGLNESLGGPARAVPGLAAAQSVLGHEVAVFGIRRSAGDGETAAPAIEVRLVEPGFLPMSSYSRRLLPQLLEWKPEIIHSHGIWSHTSVVAHRAAARLRVPHVCAPHGALDPWALAHKRLKKKLGARLYQRRILAAAECLHALVSEEHEAIREWGLKNPISVLPNGMDLSQIPAGSCREVFLSRYPQLRDRRMVLFLGRLTGKKGVMELVRAWRLLSGKRQGWRLVLAGPEDGKYGKGVRQVINDLQLENHVSHIGPQLGSQIYDCLGAADIFVLPSHSEGFSVAVLEALACAVPVCITPACHFREVEEADCGIVCEPAPTSLASSLKQLMEMDAEERAAMGRRGRALIEERFTWDRIARQMDDVYRSVLARREQQGAETNAAETDHYTANAGK